MADDSELGRMLEVYGVRDPVLRYSKEAFAENPWALPPPAPEYRHEARNLYRPGPVTEPVEKDLAAALLAPYAVGHSAGEFGANIAHSQYGPAALNALELAMAAAPIPGMKGRAPLPREVDKLGFYSQALEAAKNMQRQKGPAQGFMNDLTKAGVKKAESEATKLGDFFAANPNPTREQLVEHLRDNRVLMQEQPYLTERAFAADKGKDYDRMRPDERDMLALNPRIAKWTNYSLDPSNRTYRESVLHLPENARANTDGLASELYGKPYDELSGSQKAEVMNRAHSANFRQGHYPEPNVIAHARTSIQKDASGKPVFLIDELQSDWGQKLRDRGARNEAKIAALRQQGENISRTRKMYDDQTVDFVKANGGAPYGRYADAMEERAKRDDAVGQHAKTLKAAWNRANTEEMRLAAEIKTADSAALGHPLVNTTDQWTTTALRRLIQQAVENKAEGIALTPGQVQNERFGLEKHIADARYYPEQGNEGRLMAFDHSGRSVLDQSVPQGELPNWLGADVAERLLATKPYASGMGQPVHRIEGLDLRTGGEGMRHAYDQMYPLMLESQLKRLDPQWPGRAQTQLYGHEEGNNWSSGAPPSAMPHKGGPFSYFPLTPRIREEVAKGLPLFGAGAVAAPTLIDLLSQYDDAP